MFRALFGTRAKYVALILKANPRVPGTKYSVFLENISGITWIRFSNIRSQCGRHFKSIFFKLCNQNTNFIPRWNLSPDFWSNNVEKKSFNLCDLRLSWRWLWRLLSPWMWRRVLWWMCTDVSEECAAPVIEVQECTFLRHVRKHLQNYTASRSRRQ
jgi:hypothetical protein